MDYLVGEMHQEEKKMLSEWKNHDQNSNKVRHEVELIGSIQAV